MHIGASAWQDSNTAAIKNYAGSINEIRLERIPANERLGYVHLINILRYRRDKIKISENIILNAVFTDFSDEDAGADLLRGKYSSYNPIIERFTLRLMEHADFDVINTLVQSTSLIKVAACQGYASVLDCLRSRLKHLPGDFDMYNDIAQLNHLITKNTKYNNAEAEMADGIIRKLENTSVPVELQQGLLARAAIYDSHSGFCEEIYRCIINECMPEHFLEALLSYARENYFFNEPWMFKVLHEHGVIAELD